MTDKANTLAVSRVTAHIIKSNSESRETWQEVRFLDSLEVFHTKPDTFRPLRPKLRAEKGLTFWDCRVQRCTSIFGKGCRAL